MMCKLNKKATPPPPPPPSFPMYYTMLSTGLINIILEDSDSDDDLERTISAIEEILNKQRRTSLHRGSVYGHAYIWRDRVHGHHKLFHDYFGENPMYSPKLFRRRFRMN